MPQMTFFYRQSFFLLSPIDFFLYVSNGDDPHSNIKLSLLELVIVVSDDIKLTLPTS